MQTITPDLARPRPDRKWAASFVMGTTSSGPARSVQQAMRDAQLEAPRQCFFFCAGPYPFSRTGFGKEGAPWHVIGPAEGFHAAAGPAFFSTTFSGGSGAGTTHDVGFVTEFGLSVPPRSRVCGELLVQYRHVGDVNAGPFTETGVLGTTVTLPATAVQMNHWFVGFGAGVSF